MVLKDGAVMSKSKGNVVDPDDMIQKYGADALRLYVMFVAPVEKEVEWIDAGLEGAFRFLMRVWRFVQQWREGVMAAPALSGTPAFNDAERSLRRKTHDTIRRVTVDLDPRVHLNTAVSAQMELVNELYTFAEQTKTGAPSRRAGEGAAAAGERPETLFVVKEAVDALVLMLSPFTPHMCEELWEQLGHAGGVVRAGWPGFDAEVAKADEVVIPVQVNGKVRARITVAADCSEDEMRATALADPAVAAHTAGKTVAQVIVARGRLVSLVVK